MSDIVSVQNKKRKALLIGLCLSILLSLCLLVVTSIAITMNLHNDFWSIIEYSGAPICLFFSSIAILTISIILLVQMKKNQIKTALIGCNAIIMFLSAGLFVIMAFLNAVNAVVWAVAALLFLVCSALHYVNLHKVKELNGNNLQTRSHPFLHVAAEINLVIYTILLVVSVGYIVLYYSGKNLGDSTISIYLIFGSVIYSLLLFILSISLSRHSKDPESQYPLLLVVFNMIFACENIFSLIFFIISLVKHDYAKERITLYGETWLETDKSIAEHHRVFNTNENKFDQ